MKIIVTKARDVLTPSLKRKLAAVSSPKKALEAMGLVVVSIAQRAFTNPSLRPKTWAALKQATLDRKKKLGQSSKPLIAEGTLARSPRIVAVTSRHVTVGSDRPYAGYQQLGTSKGVPARPFFPLDDKGTPTPTARRRMLSAADRALGLGQK